MRGVRAGSRHRPGRGRRQLLRPGRAFAAGDQAGVTGPRRAGRGAAGPGGVRASDGRLAGGGAGRGGGGPPAADPGRARPERLPLSFAQQRLWFLEQLHGPGTAYNLPFAWRLHGHLDTDALNAALETWWHGMSPCARCSRSADGQPYQHVIPAGRPRCPVTVAAAGQDELAGLVAGRGPARVRPGHRAAAAGLAVHGWPSRSTCWCCCVITLPATAGRCGC